jgi:hypothetical protein
MAMAMACCREHLALLSPLFGAAATARATSRFNAGFSKEKTLFVFFLENNGGNFCEWKYNW